MRSLLYFILSCIVYILSRSSANLLPSYNSNSFKRICHIHECTTAKSIFLIYPFILSIYLLYCNTEYQCWKNTEFDPISPPSYILTDIPSSIVSLPYPEPAQSYHLPNNHCFLVWWHLDSGNMEGQNGLLEFLEDRGIEQDILDKLKKDKVFWRKC